MPKKERLNGAELWVQLQEMKDLARAAALGDEERGLDFQVVYGRVCKAMDDFEVSGSLALAVARQELNRLWGIED